MGEGEIFDGVDVLGLDAPGAAPGRVGAGGAQPDQVGAQAVDAGGEAALGDVIEGGIVQGNAGQACPRVLATVGQGLLFAAPLSDEGLRIGVEGQATANDLGAFGRLRLAVLADLEAEAVQQLRAQFAFFRVHGADQHEARRVAVGNAIAFHQVHTAGGHVEQQVHQVVGQQVHLVHVEHAAVGLGQHAGREACAAFAEGGVQVEGADDALFAGAQGQGDEGGFRQEVGDAARQGGFGHAARTFDQHAADGGVDGGEVERQLQFVGSDDRAQGKVGKVGHGGILGKRVAHVSQRSG
ncbi:hypothetical protein FQZ97_463110 [compost metagenome]